MDNYQGVTTSDLRGTTALKEKEKLMKRTIRASLLLLALLPISLSAQDSDFRMNQEFADHFAREWIEAWNAHDLERILSHYTEEFRMSSPRIIELDFSDATIHYRSISNDRLATEVFIFDEHGEVIEAFAHYRFGDSTR